MTPIQTAPVEELHFEVPYLPPSGNHYKKPNGRGGYYITPAAEAFFRDVALFARRRSVPGEFHEITLRIFLGPKMKGDVDNFNKVSLDALTRCGVLASDNSVADLHNFKRRTDRPGGYIQYEIKTVDIS